MSRKKENMEDFLKEKLDGLEHNYQTDWPYFEEKLERALFFKRMKVGAVLSAVLILISIGIFGTSSFIDSDNRSATFSHPNASEEFINEPQTRSSEEIDIHRKEDKVSPRENSAIEAAAVVLTEGVALPKVGGAAEMPRENQALNQSLNNSGSKAASNQQSKDPEKLAAIDSDEPDANNETGKALAENTVNTTRIPDVNGESDLPQKSTVENYEEGGLADLQNEAVVNPENPLEEKGSVNIASLNLNTRSLEKALNKGKTTDLDVRPPMVPVKFENGSEPYISPMQERNPWSVSVSFYPNFTFRKFKVDQEKIAFVHRDFIDATQASERGGFSLNLGLKVSRRIGPITYLNSGVEYINYKTQAEFNFTNFRDASINEETGEIMHYRFKEEPENISFAGANLYHYLNIPLSISHQPWASDHIRLNIEAGASFMYFLTARGKSINYRTLEMIDISEREYRNRIGSFSMKVGATYHVSPKFNFGFEPTLMYFTNTIYTESYPFRVIPYSVGVNLKLQMKLNN